MGFDTTCCRFAYNNIKSIDPQLLMEFNHAILVISFCLPLTQRPALKLKNFALYIRELHDEVCQKIIVSMKATKRDLISRRLNVYGLYLTRDFLLKAYIS